jgi:hypothetical protein
MKYGLSVESTLEKLLPVLQRQALNADVKAKMS